MEYETDTANLERPNRLWLFMLPVLCLVILAYGFICSKNTAGNVAFLLGYNLPIGFVVWLVFRATVARKQNAAMATLTFAAIVASLVTSNLIGYWRHASEAAKAIAAVEEELLALVESNLDEQGLPKPIERPMPTTPKSQGEIGEAERFVRTFLNRVASLNKDLTQDLEAIGWERLLSPERLAQDETLLESKAMVQKAKDAFIKYRARNWAILENAKTDIRSLNISEQNKQDVLKGFNQSLEKWRPELEAMWDLDEKVVLEFEKVISLLATRKDAWTIQEGQILFSDEPARIEFNSSLATIRGCTQKKEAVAKQVIESIKRKWRASRE